MVLEARPAAPIQRLVLSAPSTLSAPLTFEAVGSPIEFLVASREALVSEAGIDRSWATTAVYVLTGGRETLPLGAGNDAREFDARVGRKDSVEPPEDQDASESFAGRAHTTLWRARFYTGLTRDALRRLGQHAAKPWWNQALVCRQSPPYPYEISDIGFLEGKLHELLDEAYWLRREGRASFEEAVLPDRAEALTTGHLPAISAAVRVLGLPLDTREEVDTAGGEDDDD